MSHYIVYMIYCLWYIINEFPPIDLYEYDIVGFNKN